MMQFKTVLQQSEAVRFLFDRLPISSSVGRNKLLCQPMFTDPFKLQMELDTVALFFDFLEKNSHTKLYAQLHAELSMLNDISPTIDCLSAGNVLDDIQLFEIKKMSMTCQNISDILSSYHNNLLSFNDISEVVALLDPDKTNIPHFFVYSSYDERLADYRKKCERAETVAEAEQWRWKAIQVEDEVRTRLSAQLKPYASLLQQNLDQMGYLDLLCAKVLLIKKFHLCKPAVDTHVTQLTELTNPYLDDILKQDNNHFQPFSITLRQEPTLITGANMSGKTVVLKTIAMAQYLFQFGFFLPAKQAALTMVDEIVVSIGDHQSESDGLSSFAVEILSVHAIVDKAKKGVRLLALVDELARTTNPEEGKALVNAFIEMMQKYRVESVITSHYGGLDVPCHRLRVKGIDFEQIDNHICPQNINRYMDYALVETDSNAVPMDALKIASIFNVDDEFLSLAESFLKK